LVCSLFNLPFQLPFSAGWRFDLSSLLFGLLLGLLLAFIVRRLRPWLRLRRQKIAGRVRNTLAWMRSGVEVRFQSEMVEYVLNHHQGHRWAKLDQIFVPPRLLIPPQETDPKPPSDWGASQLNYLWPDLASNIVTPAPLSIGIRELLLAGRRTILSGPAGSGKSTLLAYCAYLCGAATADGPYAALFPIVPVFVHLAELELDRAEGSETGDEVKLGEPVARLAAALQKRSSPITSSGVKGMLQQRLKSGKLLLLLDGWDEIPVPSRAVATDWLANLLEEHPQIAVIVATSVTGYGPLLELGFAFTGLLPWRAGQVEKFGANWAKSYPLSQSPRASYYWRPGQSAIQNSLRIWLFAASGKANGKEFQRLKGWNELVERGLELFSQQVDEKDQASDGGNHAPDQHTLSLWERMGYELVSEGKLSLTKAEIATLVQEVLSQQPAMDRAKSSQLAKSLANTDLFITWPNETVSFLCPVWRDFMAASHMSKSGLHEEAARQAMNPHWQGALRHYVGLNGATELATQLLSVKEQSLTRDALFQVASWMAEAPDGGEWRRQTMILLGQIIRQASFAHALRQRAAAALVQTGEPGIFTFITQLLERSDPFLRQIGTAALSHIGSERAIELLEKLLEDGDPQVRMTAVRALTWIANPLTEQPLLMALIHGDDDMSRIAAKGLAQNGSEGIEILREAIEDDDLRVRRAAIQGLTLIEEAWVRPALVEIERTDDEWVVKSAASEALEMISVRAKPSPWQPLAVDQQGWLVRHAALEERSVPKGSATLPYLVQILAESSGAEQRALAATSLGQLAKVAALPALETAVRDSDKQVSEAAYTTMCLIRRAYADSDSVLASP
jgi:HEAT repeat protein